MKVDRIKKVVKRFHLAKKARGRKPGWRKTTQAEDGTILACFKKVRQPLGSLVESSDVWRALPLALRHKITKRTVANRLLESGYKIQAKVEAHLRRAEEADIGRSLKDFVDVRR